MLLTMMQNTIADDHEDNFLSRCWINLLEVMYILCLPQPLRNMQPSTLNDNKGVCSTTPTIHTYTHLVNFEFPPPLGRVPRFLSSFLSQLSVRHVILNVDFLRQGVSQVINLLVLDLDSWLLLCLLSHLNKLLSALLSLLKLLLALILILVIGL